LADYVATKDLGIDDWIDVLDSQIKEAINPIHRWEKIRSYLLNNGVSTITIARIEDKFVQSINKKNFNALQNFVEEKDSKLRTIITDFTSSLCAKLILGLVGGAQ